MLTSRFLITTSKCDDPRLVNVDPCDALTIAQGRIAHLPKKSDHYEGCVQTRTPLTLGP